jgi:hypothetical protein
MVTDLASINKSWKNREKHVQNFIREIKIREVRMLLALVSSAMRWRAPAS